MAEGIGRSSPQEYVVAALSTAFGTPMANTAVGVCELRQLSAFDTVFFLGQPMARWQSVIAEGMMLYSIACETAAQKVPQ